MYPGPGTEQAFLQQSGVPSNPTKCIWESGRRDRARKREGRRERTLKVVSLTPPVIALHEHIPLNEGEVADQLSLRRLDPLRPLSESIK